MSTVYVVDSTLVCALGSTLEESWPRLCRGESADGRIRAFNTDALGFHRAACVADPEAVAEPNRVCALMGRALEQLGPIPEGTIVIWAGVKGNAEYIEALARRGLEPVRTLDPSRAAGQATASRPTLPAIYLPRQYRRWVCGKLGIEDRGMEINAACASSTVALAVGAQMIAQGECSSALVCASDIVSHFTFTGFAALRALSPTTCRPFDVDRDGLCLGDGAVAMLLASADAVAAYGLAPTARLTGWGIANDANHITGPARDGRGLAAAIRRALARAGLTEDRIESWCPHGTGTVYNDAMELSAADAVFGGRRFPMFSVKGAIGHTLGAAGAIEAALCAKALTERVIPATSGLAVPDERAVGVIAEAPQGFPGNSILTTNSGFGGINAALIFEATPDQDAVPLQGSTVREREHDIRKEGLRVAITGASWITAAGFGRLREGGAPVLAPGKPTVPARDEVYGRGPVADKAGPPHPARYGRFDDYTRLGWSAIAMALADAGLHDSAEERPIGIVSSSTWDSLSIDQGYYQTACRDGGALASPNLFSYTLPGIMHGECALNFRMTGPTLCVGQSGGRGVPALRTALRLMADGANSAMIAGWLDDPPDDAGLPCDAAKMIGGALFVVLECDPQPFPGTLAWISYQSGQIRMEDGSEVDSILDLFEKRYVTA